MRQGQSPLTGFPASLEIDFQVEQAAVLVSVDQSADQIPVFEVALQQLAVQGHHDAVKHQANIQLRASLLCNVYNINQMGWEPVVEPFCVHLTGCHEFPQ